MERKPGALIWFLCLAALAGAAIMAVELLGARMLSVGYGASLHVWAVMISVTLLSLALGYFVGGVLADRFPDPALLSAILIVGGLSCMIFPATRWRQPSLPNGNQRSLRA